MTQLLQSMPDVESRDIVVADFDGRRSVPRSRAPVRVAFLTNEIPPYRVPLYQELAETSDWDFRVFTCIDREVDRLWNVPQSLPFSTKRSFSFSYIRRLRHTGKESFDDARQIHLPIGHFWDLYQFSPDVVISGEFGARTLIAAVYTRLFSRRLVIYYEGTTHTDRDLSAKQRLLRRLIRQAPHAYMVNGSQGRDYLQSICVPPKRVFEIGEAVDTEPFEEALTTEKRSDIRNELGVRGQCFLFCGALIPRKGLDQLFDAWERFTSQKDVNATLLVVGDGPDRAKFERRIADTGLRNVRLIGHLQRDRLPEIYHASDVFVFPTLEDCWALVVNEAMVAGLPVINSKYAGSADLITEGVTGWIIDPLDPTDTLHGLQLAWHARDDRQRMSRAARTAVATMSISAVAERIRRTVEFVRATHRKGPLR